MKPTHLGPPGTPQAPRQVSTFSGCSKEQATPNVSEPAVLLMSPGYCHSHQVPGHGCTDGCLRGSCCSGDSTASASLGTTSSALVPERHSTPLLSGLWARQLSSSPGPSALGVGSSSSVCLPAPYDTHILFDGPVRFLDIRFIGLDSDKQPLRRSVCPLC